MKKSKKSSSQKKAAQKRGTKRSARIKSTQKDKYIRREDLIKARKRAEEKFEQQMKDLFGKK